MTYDLLIIGDGASLASIPSPPFRGIEIGPLDLRVYGVLIALGVLAAFWLGGRRWAARGGDPEDLQRIGLWAVAAGLVGARVGFVLPRLGDFRGRWIETLYIWEGGLTLFGGLIGGLVVGVALARRARLDLPGLFDAVAPAIPLAQAIGRWGNWFNQELFGRPTDLPWGLEIDAAHRPVRFAEHDTFHPTFLYESLGNLTIVAILVWIDRRRLLPRGALFAAYLVLYGVGRFGLELIRVDTTFRFLGLSRNAFMALGAVLVGSIAIAVLTLRSRPAGEPVSPSVEP